MSITDVEDTPTVRRRSGSWGRVSARVMQNPRLSMQAKAVYGLLASYADDGNRECHPRQSTMAEQMDCSVDTLQRHIRALEDAGLVEVVARFRPDGGRMNNDYVLLDDLGTHAAPVRDGSRTGAATPPLMDAVATTRPEQHDQTTRPDNIPPKPPDADVPLLALVAEPEPPAQEDDFDQWWSLYPRKVGKDAARRAYAKAVKRAAPAVIYEGLWLQLGALGMMNKPDGDYRPHPSTWLNRGSWEDRPEDVARPAMPQGRNVNVAAHLLARSMAADAQGQGMFDRPAMKGLTP